MGSPANGTLRKDETWFGSLQRLADAVIIVLAQLVAWSIRAESWNEHAFAATVLGLLVYGFATEAGGLHRPYRMETILRETKDTLVSWLTSSNPTRSSPVSFHWSDRDRTPWLRTSNTAPSSTATCSATC